MSARRRILIVVASLTGGGAERVAVTWADTLSLLGHDVAVLTDTCCPITFRPSASVKVFPLDFPDRTPRKGVRCLLKALRSRVHVFRRLSRLMRTERPDVVIDIGHFYSAEVLAASRLHGVKALQTNHNACTRPEGLSFHTCMRKFVFARFYDAITVLTEVDRHEMVRRGVRKAEVLHNPLSLVPCAFSGLRSKTVLAVGRLDAWYVKGFDVLLSAWRYVSCLHSDWRLRIIGNGSAESLSLLQEMCRESLNTVDFVPFTADIDIEYRRAEIFVLSSRCEGWGLVATEAMSQGCAAVVCDYDGRQAEYACDEVNALICPTDDASALAQRIDRLINDECLRKRLGGNAARSLDRLAPDVVGRRLEKIICCLCSD